MVNDALVTQLRLLAGQSNDGVLRGPALQAADRIAALTAELEAERARAENYATLANITQHGWDLAKARVAVLEGALIGLLKHRVDVEADVLTSHRNRGDGASEWMREDDRDFRRDLSEAFDAAHDALNTKGPTDASQEK